MCPEDVRLEDVDQVGPRHVGDIGERTDSRRVHDRVETTHRRRGLRDGGAATVVVASLARHSEGGVTEVVDGRGACRPIGPQARRVPPRRRPGRSPNRSRATRAPRGRVVRQGPSFAREPLGHSAFSRPVVSAPRKPPSVHTTSPVTYDIRGLFSMTNGHACSSALEYRPTGPRAESTRSLPTSCGRRASSRCRWDRG